MDPLSITAGAITLLQVSSVVVKYCYNYRNDVKSARRDASRIIDEVRSLEKVLERLIETVDEEVAAAKDMKSGKLSAIAVLSESDGPIKMIEKELLALRDKLIPPRSKWETIKKDMKWPLEKRDVEKTLESIGKIKSTLALALSTDQRTLTVALRHEIGALKASFYSIKSDEAREKIFAWLGAVDSTFDNDQAQKKRQALTGYWLIDSSAFATWLTQDNSHMWLHGLPGCGKTILCSTAIESVKSHCVDSDRKALAYFFFDFNDITKRRFRTMLCALIKLFSVQHSKCPDALRELHQYHASKGRIPSDDALVDCLHDIMRPMAQCYIILDGLDESIDREDVLKFLERTVQWELPSLHLLVFSRREKDIQDGLVSLLTDQIAVSSTVVDGDIKAYVRERLKTDTKLQKWPSKVQEEIHTTLAEKSRGMFRWTVCQLDAISSCVRLAPLRNALNQLPKTLDETYNRILSGIAEEYYEDTFKLLQWLCFAKRPLRMAEICEVLAVDPGQEPRFSTEQRLLEPLALLSLCSSLIVITPKSFQEGEEIVKLAHSSVREYLTSTRIKSTEVSSYYINEEHAQREIAEICLSYLLHFNDPVNALDEDGLSEYPLYEYAAQYWALHFPRVQQGESSDRMNDLGDELLQEDSFAFLTWLRVYDPESPFRHRDFNREEDELRSPLFYIAYYGLESLVERFMDRPSYGENRADDIGLAIETAASKGHRNILTRLIGNNKEELLDSIDKGLQLACQAGHLETSEYLVDQGASIDARDEELGTALQAACASQKDNKAIVNFLLSKGAVVNTTSGYFANPLQAAAFNGKDYEVKLLLKAKADVNASGGCYDSALQAAAGQGHDKVVRTLLEAGADVNKQHCMRSFQEIRENATVSSAGDQGVHGTALQAASMNGYEQVVKILLDHKADVNASGAFFGTALGVAAYYNQAHIVRLLLAQGTDIDKQGGEGSFQGATPLKMACMKNNASIASLLLEHKANVNVSCGKFSNALQATAYNGNKGIVQLLLDYGADIAASSGDFPSAMDAAIRGHQSDMVEMLIEAGATVETPCKHGDPLGAALHEGHELTVEVLLRKGFGRENRPLKVEESYLDRAKNLIKAHESSLTSHVQDAQNSLFDLWEVSDPALAPKLKTSASMKQQALIWAVSHNKVGFVEYIFNQGFDTETLDWHLKTPLHWAAGSGSEEALTCLLEKGAKTDVQDRYGETPLHYAAENGHLDCAKALVSWGANWTIRDNPIRWGRTPWKCAAESGHMQVASYLGGLHLPTT